MASYKSKWHTNATQLQLPIATTSSFICFGLAASLTDRSTCQQAIAASATTLAVNGCLATMLVQRN
jgi:hypothetical protein